MKLKILLKIYLLLVLMTLNLKANDFCFLSKNLPKQIACKSEQCRTDLCAIDKKTCKYINDWYLVVEKYISGLNIRKNTQKFSEFLKESFESIKECKPSEYIDLNKQACSIKESCQFNQNLKLIQLLKPSKLIMPKRCACSGKFSFKCGKYICSDDEKTCNKSFKFLKDMSYIKNLKKC